MFGDSKNTRYFILLLCGVVAFYTLHRFGHTFLSVISPFAAAIVFAYILYSPSKYISKKLHIPKGLACAFTVISFFAVLFTAVYLVASKLFCELSGVAKLLPSLTDNIPSALETVKRSISELFPFADAEKITELLKTALLKLTAAITEKITLFIPSAAIFVPKFIIAFFVTVIATCYFTKDLDDIKSFFLCQLPEKYSLLITECQKQLFDISGKYIGAYLTIALITFAELFAGLMFISREYAFLLALIITVVDILPIFGSGAILLPWAFCEYALKDPANGTKLLLLYIVVCTVRQFIEPKIVGDFIGLYPLTALFCVFAGGILMGVFGMFLFPVCAIILKNLNEKGLLRLYRSPPEKIEEKISCARTKYKKFRKS